MKPKQLTIMGVVVVVLLGLVVLKEWSERPPDITEQVDLQSLVPAGVSRADLARLELYVGGKPEQKVVLERTEDGGDWQVASHFNAPVSETKIDRYLDSLLALKGESRPTSEGEGVLESYELTDDTAFHIYGYKKDGPEPAVHLLVGKEADYRTVFMRPAESHAVYVVNTNLRREAGLYDTSAELKADTWLDKNVIDLTVDDVVQVALNESDKQLVFEKREKPAEETADDEESAEGEAETPPAPAAPETEWVVAEGGPGLPLKQQSAVPEYLRTFASLLALDIVDPSKPQDYGLENPDYRVAFKLRNSDDEVVLEGGRPGPEADEGYIRVASGKADLVYKVSKSSFERAFPKGSQFFDLAGLALDSNTLDRIEVVQPEGNIVAVRKGSAWTLEQPSTGLKVKDSALSEMAAALATWMPADYAASAEGRGFDNPTRRVTFTAGPNVSHTIVLGSDAQSVDGAYARLDDGETVLVMAEDVREKVFLTPGKLFDLKLVDTLATDITRITLTRDGETVTATRAGDEPGPGSGWTLTVNGAEVPASETALDDLAYAVAGLEADDFQLYTAPSAEAVHATVSYTPRDGEPRTITIGPKVDETYPTTVSGKQGVFMLAEVDVQGVTPDTDSLKAETPAEGESDDAAEEPAAADDADTAPETGEATAETDSAPAEPAPTEEPASEPAPTDAATAEPAMDAAPAEPVTEATPTDTAPTEPAPKTASTDAVPAEPAPQSPEAATQPVAPTEPAASEAPEAPAPAEDTPAAPASESATPDNAASSEEAPAAEPASTPEVPESVEIAPAPAPSEAPAAPETAASDGSETPNAPGSDIAPAPEGTTEAPEEVVPAPAADDASEPAAEVAEPAVQP